MPAVLPQAYSEIIELFASGPSPEAILSFKPSEESQARVRDLLQKSRDGTLSQEERDELEQFSHVEHFMRLVKARARQYASR